jgi:ribosome-associated protein
MDISKLQRVVVDALENVKAQNIKVYNTVGLSDMFDRVVLASGTSNRQTRALAYRVAQQVKEAGGHVVSVEGADAGEWVLVDLGDLVVHVMQPAVREYYGLEEIWGGKPVRVRLAESAARRIAGRGNGADQALPSAPAAKTRPRRTTAKAAGAKPRATAAPSTPTRAGAATKKLRKSAAKKAARVAAPRPRTQKSPSRARGAPAKKRSGARKMAPRK